MERTEALDRECCELDAALRTARLDLSRERAAVASLQQELSDVRSSMHNIMFNFSLHQVHRYTLPLHTATVQSTPLRAVHRFVDNTELSVVQQLHHTYDSVRMWVVHACF
jgi:hypothetical protein